MLLHKHRITIRFCCISKRRSHIVHQSQTVTYLMRYDIAQTLVQYILRKFGSSHSWINLCRLHKSHIIHQLDNIMIYKYRGINNLTISGINPWWSHRIRDSDRSIINTVILYISRIKFRIIFREVFHLHYILKANTFKSFIPYQHPFMNTLFPFFRESIVNIKKNRLRRFNKFSSLVSFYIFRIYIPLISISIHFHSVIIISNLFLIWSKIANARISHTRHHFGSLRQQNKWPVYFYRNRFLIGNCNNAHIK